MDVIARVLPLVEPLVEADGIELVDVQLTGGSLQVFVDRPGGLDLEAISVLSRRISAALDESDPVPGRYVLEVSSPGLERPLRRPEHFRRFVGTTVSVKTRPGVEGERRRKGILEGADDHGIVLAGGRLSYDEIESARTVFEWGGQPKKARRANKSARNGRVAVTAPGGDGAPTSARSLGDVAEVDYLRSVSKDPQPDSQGSRPEVVAYGVVVGPLSERTAL